MQLESHATPAVESPQQRYATLHRALERGLESDEVWKELAEVSVKLGHGDEAIRCLPQIRDEALRRAVEIRFMRIGLLRDTRRDAAAEDSTGAPAASDAGEVHDSGRLGLQDHLADAIEFLLHQHMPWLVLGTTLAFPLVVGLGGFLTAGGSLWLLAAIAAIPGLSVLGLVGAMARRVLLSASNGSDEVPRIPELADLVVDARRFLADTALVFGALVAPSLIAFAMGVPARTALPAFLVGAFFTPMAWLLRQLRGDFQALAPVVLVRATSRCGVLYALLVPVFWALFAPAAMAAWLVAGRPAWVQIAAVGPLAVLPLFVVARLLGTWVDRMRLQLGGLVPAPDAADEAPVVAAAPVATAAPAAPLAKRPAARPEPAQPATEAPRLPKRPASLEHFAAPLVERLHVPEVAPSTPSPARPAAAPAGPAAAAPKPSPARPAQPQPAAPAPRAPAAPAEPAAKPAAAAQRPARPEPRAIAGKSPQRRPQPEAQPPQAKQPPQTVSAEPQQSLSDLPDLSNMPGAVVVTGRDRVRHGAASSQRPM